ncbi:MAG: hypothetical protein WD266_04125 [Balneolales bacterium]
MSFIKRVVRGFTAPIFKERIVSRTKRVPRGPVTRKILTGADSSPEALFYATGQPVFSIPVSRLRYFGGLAFFYDQHHFMQYYKEGPAALVRYYKRHQPGNIFEKHFLPTPANRHLPHKGISGNPWLFGVPWLYTHDTGTYNGGEKGLGPEHGIQAYGPVTNEKIMLETRRLSDVLKSIKKTGFKPDVLGGYPRGYFLMDLKGRWSFLLDAGLHRVAALVHLGYRRIPVQFQTAFPRVIKQAESRQWPMVKKRYLSEKEAVDIFMQYLKPDGLKA